MDEKFFIYFLKTKDIVNLTFFRSISSIISEDNKIEKKSEIDSMIYLPD